MDVSIFEYCLNIVRSIARRLLTKELGKSFSRCGLKGNRELKNTVGKIIMGILFFILK
jgi:hypothetical protein